MAEAAMMNDENRIVALGTRLGAGLASAKFKSSVWRDRAMM